MLAFNIVAIVLCGIGFLFSLVAFFIDEGMRVLGAIFMIVLACAIVAIAMDLGCVV